ncbi:MAG: hypothetical protein WBD31_27485 [Rubripirellula sp.]
MKKFTFLCMAALCLSFVTISGCGGGTDVVEVAPDTPTEDPAMEGMTDEEYNKAMEADMNN